MPSTRPWRPIPGFPVAAMARLRRLMPRRLTGSARRKQILLFAVEILLYPGTVLSSVLACRYLLGITSPEFIAWVPSVPVGGCVVLFMTLEQVMPYRPEWREPRGDTLSDAVRTFGTLPIASKLAEAAAPIVLYFPIAWLTERMGSGLWPMSLNFWLQCLIALLAAEFFYYWTHRLSHAVPLLWRFHAVHHGAERVYWLNAGRFHSVDAFLGGLAYFVPLALLGVPQDILLTTITISAVTGFMEHVNIRFRAGPLNYFFNTAQLHRWHHSSDLRESNTNYGKALSVWDLAFGTFHLPKGRVVGDVGVQGAEVPADFFGQTVYPFRKERIDSNEG